MATINYESGDDSDRGTVWIHHDLKNYEVIVRFKFKSPMAEGFSIVLSPEEWVEATTQQDEFGDR